MFLRGFEDMKVKKLQGKWLFVAETSEENNAVASIISLLTDSNRNVTEDEANDHGCGFNNAEPFNYVYLPSLEQLEDI